MKSRNKQIEGLRAIAILFVMFFHFFFRYQQLYHAETYSILGIRYWGNFGVGIFLMISTYFLSLMKSQKILKILCSKIMRLWPAYFICIIIIFGVLHVWPLPDRSVSITDLAFNIFMVNGYINIPYVDGAHWYIGVLLSLTVIFGVLVNLNNTKKDIFMAIWVALDICLFSCMRLDGGISTVSRFLIGLVGNIYVPYALLGYCIACIEKGKPRVKYYIGIVIGMLGIYYMTNIGQTISVMCAMVVFIFALKQRIHFLENKGLICVGEASYCIYLIHQNIGYDILYSIEKQIGYYEIWQSFLVIILMVLIGITLNVVIEKTIVPYVGNIVEKCRK